MTGDGGLRMARLAMPSIRRRGEESASRSGCDWGSLAQQAQGGDRAAFARLYECTSRGVHGVLRRMVGTDEEALDLSQDTYLEAWRSLRSLKDPGAFRTWVFRIAANKARDFLKRRRVPTSSLDALGAGPEEREDGTAFEPRDPGPEPAAAVLADERAERVRKAMESLPEGHREVVWMYYVGELEVKEIAAALGLPKGTVLSRLARGRDALRRELEPYLEEGDEL